MHKNPMKFENRQRLDELDIVNSLKRAGLNGDKTVCDYGAGTGIFTVEAAKMTENKVYALDMDQAMVDLTNAKVDAQGLTNVETMVVKADLIPLEDNSVDLFVVVTVLHEIEDVPTFIEEVHRVLTADGRVMVIDFYKKESPMGPPLDHRMSAYQASRHFFREGINLVDQHDLGENLYQLILQK